MTAGKFLIYPIVVSFIGFMMHVSNSDGQELKIMVYALFPSTQNMPSKRKRIQISRTLCRHVHPVGCLQSYGEVLKSHKVLLIMLQQIPS